MKKALSLSFLSLRQFLTVILFMAFIASWQNANSQVIRMAKGGSPYTLNAQQYPGNICGLSGFGVSSFRNDNSYPTATNNGGGPLSNSSYEYTDVTINPVTATAGAFRISESVETYDVDQMFCTANYIGVYGNAYDFVVDDLSISAIPAVCQATSPAFNLMSYSIPNIGFGTWRVNGTIVGSGIFNPSLYSPGTYTVQLTRDYFNGTLTATQTILVMTPISGVAISDASICAGSSATFSVTQSGTGPFSYQWFESTNGGASYSGALTNAGNYSGATTNSLSVANASNGNFYKCLVSGPCSNVESNAARVIHFSQVGITASPSNSPSNCIGSSASFTATGTPRNGGLQYRWQYFNGSSWVDLNDGNDGTGTIFSGTGASTMSISNLRIGYNGFQVRCRLFDNCGTTTANTTSPATLSVFSAVSIGSQPTDKQACLGSNTSFSVGATAGNGGLSYRWERDSGGGYVPLVADANFSNVGSPTLNISNVFSGLNANRFRCFVWDGCGQGNGVNSTGALLTTLTPVSVPTSPVAVTQCAGTNATFTSTSSGTGLSYQWQQDGVDIANGSVVSGATTSTLTLTGIFAGLNGKTYRLKATGSCNTEFSSGALLTVNSPVSITTQPTSTTTLCVGAGYTISVSATGTITGYQWRKNGTNISGANASSFSIPLTASADAGNYDVVISGSCAPITVTSNLATLTINTPVSIQTQPSSSTTICAGSMYNISVAATGTITSYQWRKNGSNIAGANGASFSIPLTASADAGNYDVVISGPCGSPTVTSNLATLTINTPVSIQTQPSSSTTICAGSMYNISVAATGTITSYQWRKNGSNISGANASSFSIPISASADAGNYDVVISGSCAPITVTSNLATLTINTPVSIQTQPSSSTTICAGSMYNISVAATGTITSYQWRKNGSNIAGANGASFSIPLTASADAGNYDVVISGPCGSPTVTSNLATLTINTPVSIQTHPLPSIALCLTSGLNISVTATGTITGYQWRKNGTNIPGANGAAYNVASVTIADDGIYDVVITAACGSAVTSTAATTTITVPPAITSDPSATITCAGVSASFSVGASGSGLTYQWSFNGTNITGATSSTYTISNPQAVNIGNYRVTVTNGCGSVPSAPVLLTVNPIAGIATQPVNSPVCPGGTISLSTAANGTGPFTYVWEKEVSVNNWSVTGTNSPILSFSNVTSAEGGNYRVKVSGACGSQVTSTTATVTVNPTPALPIALDASRCADGPLSITASSPSPTPTFNWYNTDSDASPAFVGNTRTYPTLTVTTVQFVSVVSLGCESGRKQVNFNRFNTKSVDLGAALSLCVAQGVYNLENDIADPIAKGSNFTWVANSVNFSSKIFNPNVGQGTYVVSYNPPTSAAAAPNCYLPTDRTVIVITNGGNGGLTFTDPKISTGNTVNACVGDAPIVISNYPNVAGGTWSTVTGSGLSNSGSSSVFIPDASNFTSTTPNTFRYTVVTGGCSVSKDLFIFVKDNQSPPAVAGLPAVACPGTLMNLTASVSVPGTFAFEWYKSGNPVPFASGSVLSYTSTINEDLLVRSVNTSFGCRSSSTTVAIRTPFSSGTISVSKNVLNIGDFVKYNYSVNTTGNTYTWDFGDGGSSTEFSPAYYYYKPGQFSTKLKVTSTLGCSQDTQYDFIKVNGTPYSVVTGNEPITGLPSDTFNVYPIPAGSTLNVDGHKGAAYTIFSMSGTAVLKTVAENDNVKLDLSSLSSGIYKLLINYGFVTKSVTIVKE